MTLDLTTVSARRKLYLSLAWKRVRPGTGSGRDLLLARTWRQPVFDLRSLVSVPFVVVGGVAMRLYAPERMTDDLDVLIASEDAGEFYAALARGGGEKMGTCAIDRSDWRLPDGTVLDVLESSQEWVRDAVQTPAVGYDGLPVIRLPYLVLMKMQASRGIDIGDLTRILGAADEEALTETRAVVQRFLNDGVEDLESLIELGRLELRDAQRP